MKKLSPSAFQRARAILQAGARPLERARFAHEFEAAPADAVCTALAAFQNADGGFAALIEPDLRLRDSTALGALTALDVLREIGESAASLMLRRAVAWLVERYDPALPGWRCVPPDVDRYPHAAHWAWELHRPGGPWPHVLIPGARLLSHLEHWSGLAPEKLVAELHAAFAAQVAKLGNDVGGDSLYYASTVADPVTLARCRELACATVCRDPAKWREYVSKPLKLAPLPDAPLARVLARELDANLDWEIDVQSNDGAWDLNWDWGDAHPDDWAVARREWRGVLTLERLRSLRAFGRIEGLAPRSDLPAGASLPTVSR